ncbi:TPA: 50S ribosomal protein L24 [Candidatus Nomurabacteria bacterium]|nr:MAG: 50S ribosomal protein L24 [Parcubacteria bacterium RAAC4_OD1_1]HCY26264.1 50S ribosomal protein L24 [Candidatus Nomurabacteria bacterium]
MKIKKGDNVIVLAGDDKGKKGKILKVFPVLNKIVVEGVNVVKKAHKKKNKGDVSQMIEVPMPINASNVAKKD